MAEYFRAEINTILSKISTLNSDLLKANSKQDRRFILEELEVAYCELLDAISDYRHELAEV